VISEQRQTRRFESYISIGQGNMAMWDGFWKGSLEGARAEVKTPVKTEKKITDYRSLGFTLRTTAITLTAANKTFVLFMQQDTGTA